MTRMTELEAKLEKLLAVQAACEVKNARLEAKVELLEGQVAELQKSKDDLLTKLLDLGTGRVQRAEERGDARFKLVLDKLGGPIGKAIGAFAVLVLTGLMSWWAGHFGMGLPVSTIASPAPQEGQP